MAVSVNLAISVTFIGSTFTVSKNSPDTKPPMASCNFAGSNFILLFQLTFKKSLQINLIYLNLISL